MAASGGHWLKMAQGNSGKMVFVPKGQTPGQAITGRRPQGGGFPESLDEVQNVKSLGGSTGAMLVQDKAGNLYVKKKGNSAEHLLEEGAADSAYQAMGMDVPPHKIYMTPGGPVKLAKFVDGQTLDQAQANNPAAAAKAVLQLQKGFVADAVLGNWDVIGLGRDNIMIGKNGKVYRIDNGGSLRYRAQGGKKGSAWNDTPNEIFSMRSVGTAGQVFKRVTASDIASQAGSLIANKRKFLAALPASVRSTVGNRIDKLQVYRNAVRTLKLSGKSDKQIDDFVMKFWKTGKPTPKPGVDIERAYSALMGG